MLSSEYWKLFLETGAPKPISCIRKPCNRRNTMYLTIRAIVLRVTDYNDHDALLTVLNPELW